MVQKNLDYTDITFPVAQKDYRKIEIMNNINISVFRYEKQEPYPVYISNEKLNNMLDLLLITEGKKQHYVLIRKQFCMYCLQCFRYVKAFINHKENFITINDAQAIKMPKADDMVYFKNYQKGLAAPFVIYADFETIAEKVDGCQPNNDKSYTELYQRLWIWMKVVCHDDDKYSKPVQIYKGENAVHKLMEKMLKEAEWCKK